MRNLILILMVSANAKLNANTLIIINHVIEFDEVSMNMEDANEMEGSNVEKGIEEEDGIMDFESGNDEGGDEQIQRKMVLIWRQSLCPGCAHYVTQR